MRYASVCDGIGAVHVAWRPLGWECAWTSEIEAFPAAVVEHHHGYRNMGDMTAITQEMLYDAGPISLFVGGTPCQSFSVAGLRKGMADPRGNLALRFVQLVGCLRPDWVVWENVPGVLSSNGGRDFGTFLGALGELGYGFAYRVLDAQWFGVAQRRRRVFVVGYLGDWRRSAAVLFERESVFGNPPTRGATGQDAAGSTGNGAARCVTSGEFSRQDWETCNFVAGTLNANGKAAGSATQQDAEQGLLVAFHPTQDPISSDDGLSHAIATGSKGGCATCAVLMDETVGSLRTNHRNNSDPVTEARMHIPTHVGIRRLTPRECERLQGFPDDYTAISYRGKTAADGPRYRALGNSMAVPVMAWIGRRIAGVGNA